jgi:putative PIN family toxin of toxin-antitoxin system
LGELELFISLDIINELKDVLSRKKFGFSQQEIHFIEKELEKISTCIYPTTKLNIVKADKQDNKILECAVESKSQYLISGDKHLKNLKKYKNIKILSPEEFLILKTNNELNVSLSSKNTRKRF